MTELAEPSISLAASQQDRPLTPTALERPSFLVNAPFSYSTDVPNNVWMEDLSEEERVPEPRKAMVQFLELYRFLASEALVYVLPTPVGCGLQDLVFTANLGIVLDHLPDRNVVVLSNYTSEPRREETAVGIGFFEQMGYETHVAPHEFEGEAELKHLHDNVYAGGYGIRSSRATYDWMEETFGMEVVKLRETDPYLYHLDCSILPITREDTVVCTEMFEPGEVEALEQHTNVIDVPVDIAFTGGCNSVRLGNLILNASHVHELRAGTEDYDAEVKKNRFLEDVAIDHALEVNFFNLSGYHKGGALLSCMVMHLNRYSYAFKLV